MKQIFCAAAILGTVGAAMFTTLSCDSVELVQQPEEKDTNVASSTATGGPVDPWQVVGSLPSGTDGEYVVVSGNHMYATSYGSTPILTWYAPVQANGTPGTWLQTSAAKPAPVSTTYASSGDAIYRVGGQFPGPIRSVEFALINYDGSLGPWTETSSLNGQRADAALAIANGYIYVAGGWSANWTFLTTVEFARINTDGTLGPWQYTSPMQVQRPHPTLGVVDGYIYAFGGARHSYITDTVERAPINTDGSIGTWVYDRTLPSPRGNHGMAVVGDTVYLIGGLIAGWCGNEARSVIYADVQADHTLGQWTSTEPIVNGFCEITGSQGNEYVYATAEGSLDIQMARLAGGPAAEATITGIIEFVDADGNPLPKPGIPRRTDELFARLWPVEDPTIPQSRWLDDDYIERDAIFNPPNWGLARVHFEGLEVGDVYDIGVSVWGGDLKLLRTSELAEGENTINFVMTRADLVSWKNLSAAAPWIAAGTIPFAFGVSVAEENRAVFRDATAVWEKVLTDSGRRCVDFVETSVTPLSVPWLQINNSFVPCEDSAPACYYPWLPPLVPLPPPLPRVRLITFDHGLDWYHGAALMFHHEYYQFVLRPRWAIGASTQDTYSLLSIATHELGHALGCGEAHAEATQYDARGEQYSIMTQEYTLSTGWSNHIHWLGWSDAYTVRRLWSHSLRVLLHCPVDMQVTDGLGQTISKSVNEIPGAEYIEVDIDGDGEPDDQITILDPVTGEYLIQLLPEEDADPDARVTLEITDHGLNRILLDEVPVADLPTGPIQLMVDRTPPDLSTEPVPAVLGSCVDEMVAVSVDIQLQDEGDPSPQVALVGIEPSWEADPSDISGAVYGEDDRGFELRATCDPGGSRTYTITYTAVDATRNVSTATAVVTIPRQVLIDIKPGSDPNSINLGSHGVIPVAILTTGDFDATTVDPNTVALAGSGVAIRGNGSRLLASQEDVDDDGDIDLMLHVETENLDLQTGSTEAVLTAHTYDGELVSGSDTVNIVAD